MGQRRGSVVDAAVAPRECTVIGAGPHTSTTGSSEYWDPFSATVWGGALGNAPDLGAGDVPEGDWELLARPDDWESCGVPRTYSPNCAG